MRWSSPIPENIGSRYPHQVSRRPAAASDGGHGLCGEPDLLVLDDPTALDAPPDRGAESFQEGDQGRGAAAIYVYARPCGRSADRRPHCRSIQWRDQGSRTGRDHHHKSEHPDTKRLMGAIEPLPKAGLGEASNHAHMRDVPALEAKSVDAGYGRVPKASKTMVLRDVNVAIERGKTVGIIGESGCGKSTLARVFAGLLPPSDGHLKLDGESIARIFATGRGRASQDPVRLSDGRYSPEPAPADQGHHWQAA